jgi:hypothetical protein
MIVRIIAIILLWCSSSWAATFYIDFTAGDDTRSSTLAQSKATPWKHCKGMGGATSDAAAYSVQAGDIFVFKGGETWPAASMSLTLPASGTAGNIIQYTVDATWYSGGSWTRPTLDGDNSLGRNSYLIGDNSAARSYILIDNLALKNVGSDNASGSCVKMTGGGSSIEIKNCLLQPEAIEAFSLSSNGANASAYYVHHNTIRRAGRATIYGDTGYILDDVRVYNNDWQGPSDLALGAYHLDGLMIGNSDTTTCGTGGVATVTNILFYNNKFYGDWNLGATAQFYSNGCTSNTTIYNNLFSIENVSGTGPLLSPGFVTFNNKDGGNINIWNNTFSSDSYPGYGTGTNKAIHLGGPGTATAISIKNNIMSGMAIDVSLSAGYDSLAMNYNLHNPSNVGGYGHLLWIETTSYTTLAAVQGIELEANSPAVSSPLFTTIPNGTTGSGDWALQAASPAINAAVSLSGNFTTDILGVTRGASWDIGAYEYVPPTTYMPWRTP